MQRFGIFWVSAFFLASAFPCVAEAGCPLAEVQARVETANAELTLADLLPHNACVPLQQAAAQVRLGALPRSGRARVLDGREVRSQLESVTSNLGMKEIASLKIPERIVVGRAGASRSCEGIAQFLAGAAPAGSLSGAPTSSWDSLNCAAARDLPQDTPLQLAKTSWNASLHRWEFTLRCVRPRECVPFLVWLPGENAFPKRLVAAFRKYAVPVEHVIKAGQTATLAWDEVGIRIVLPVTCLDAGGIGEFVRIRFKNSAAILRAEVLPDGTLRASL